MALGIDKHKSRENRAKVRDVLMREWDPIGVGHVPEASDEYDAYVGKVYVMLMNEDPDERAINVYLYDIATNYMGLTPYAGLTDACAKTAAILISLKPEFALH